MGRRILCRVMAVLMVVMVCLFGIASAEEKIESAMDYHTLDLKALKDANADRQKYLIPWQKLKDNTKRYVCEIGGGALGNDKRMQDLNLPNTNHLTWIFGVFLQKLDANATDTAKDYRTPLYTGRYDLILSAIPDGKDVKFDGVDSLYEGNGLVAKTLYEAEGVDCYGDDWERYLADWKAKNIPKGNKKYKEHNFTTASGNKVYMLESWTESSNIKFHSDGATALVLVEIPSLPEKHVLRYSVEHGGGFGEEGRGNHASQIAKLQVHLSNLSITASEPIVLDIWPENLKAEAGGDKEAVTVTTKASGTPGEDGGVAIPIAIVIGSAAAAAALGAAAGSGKDEEPKQSSFRLYVYKNFGDTLQACEKPRPIYARIAEITPEGAEVPRDDLSSQITISSGTPGLNVWDGGMVNGYKGAELSIPDASFKESECVVSFRFTGEGGILTENMIFNVMGEARINFGQENLTLPARYDKAVRLPFGIPNFGDISQATVTAEVTPEGGYTVTLESDLKYPGVFYANIKEEIKDEKEPGEIDIYSLNVKASRILPDTGEEQVITKELPLYRMHMGLILDIDGINCCGFLKEEAKSKRITNIKKEDFECGTTEAYIKLLTWDEETNSVFTMAPIPVEGSFKVAPKEEDEGLKKIIENELKLEMAPIEAGPKGTKCIIVGRAVLDPPSRYAAVLSMTLKWTRRDGKEEVIPFRKEITLRSQPLLNIKDADKARYLKETSKFSELLDHIITRIDGLNLYEQLFSLYNLAKVMQKGYRTEYGYDPYQVAKVKYIWGKFNRGKFTGTNVDPDVLPPTLADEAWMWTLSTMEMGEVVEEKLGFMGRMVLGYYTAGLSEAAFLTLKSARNMVAYAENDAIEDSKKTTLGMFWAGVKPVAIQFLLQNSIELVARNIGNPSATSLKNEMDILMRGDPAAKATGALLAERYAAVGRFFNPRTIGARMKNAVESTKSALQSAKDKGRQLIDKFRGGSKSPAEELAETVHKKAAQEGEELVRKLEQMAADNKDIVQKIKQRAAGEIDDLPGGVGEYLELDELGDQITRRLNMEKLILEIQSNKSAMRFLKNWKGANAKEVRAVFNNSMLNFYDDIGEAWLTEISAATGCSRSSLSILNKSSTGLKKLREGITTTFDKDWTPQIVDSSGKVVNVDLEVATKTFNKVLYMRGHGGRLPPSEEAAAAYARRLDQTVVSEGHAEMYGKYDDVDKAIDPARQGEGFTDPEGVARAAAFKGADRFREAAEYTEEAMKLSDDAMRAANVNPGEAAELMKKSIELMKSSAREGQEGLRQMTKQFNNIIIPKNEIAKSLGRPDVISQRIYDMMDVVRRCSDTGEISYEAVKGILKKDFGVTMEEFAHEVGDLLKKIDLG